MDITIVPLEESTTTPPYQKDFYLWKKPLANRMYLARLQTAKRVWYQRDIDAYQNISLDPATACVSIMGKSCFEGTKAYRRA